MNTREVNIWFWTVRRLPKKLVYFCAVHVLAYATTHEFSNQEVSTVPGMAANKSYADAHKIYNSLGSRK